MSVASKWAMPSRRPELLVGAGTVLDVFAPGVMTRSELGAALRAGSRVCKYVVVSLVGCVRRWPANVRRAEFAPSFRLLGRTADNGNVGAYITVSDAAGRVLFRRPATDDEVMSALAAAQIADAEAQAAIDRIAHERTTLDTVRTDEAE